MKKHVDQLVKSLTKIEEGIAEVKTLAPMLFDGAVAGGGDESTEENSPKKGTKSAPKKTSKKEEIMNEPEDSSDEIPSREDLDSMKYNDLKKYGASLGIKCTGTRDEITEKILSALEGGAGDSEEDEKVVPIDKNKKASSKTSSKTSDRGKASKKSEPEPEDEDEEEDQLEEYLQIAREYLEEYDLEDIVEILGDCGVKLTARQKKQQDVVMRKLAEAIAEGLIEVEDDEEEEGEGAEESTEETGEFTADSYFPDYDPEGFNDPDNMTKKRKKACEKKVSEILEAYESEDLTTDDIEEELQDIISDEESDLLGDDYEEEELLALYIEKKKHFIDDEGEESEPGEPYEVGGSNFCCGHELKYSKKTNRYICETCGEEYEAD